MSDHFVSLIRTYVPAVVGVVIAWLATLGINVDTSASVALIVGITGLSTAIYYTAVRLVESRWPVLGILLGIARPPAYGLEIPPSLRAIIDQAAVREELEKRDQEVSRPRGA